MEYSDSMTDADDGDDGQGRETVVDLLVDLDILCKKLETIGQDTLVLCTGSENIIASSVAASFFKPVETVLSQFKNFCLSKKSATVPVSTSEVPNEVTITVSYDTENNVNIYSDIIDEEMDTSQHASSIICDMNDPETNKDVNLTEENALVNNEQDVINICVQDLTKPDGTEFFSDNSPKKIAIAPQNTKSTGTQSSAEKKHVIINNEKWTLISPEDSGIDFKQDENGTFDCFKCEKTTTSLSRLREHLTKVHKTKIGHQCVCDRFFQDTESYNKHREHRSYELFHHKCPQCDKVFPTNVAMKSHLSDFHGANVEETQTENKDEDEYPCPKCQNFFSHRNLLLEHQENFPNCDTGNLNDDTVKEELLKTEITYTLGSGESVTKTYGEISSSVKGPPFVCPCCDDSSAKRSNFMRHLLRHLSSGSHPCLICGYRFKGKEGLQRHLMQHKAKPFGCRQCKSRFATESELTLHINSLCKAGDRTDFQCDLCDYKAVNASSLFNHKNMHAGVRPYHCELCDKSFASKSSMERHKAVIHEDATPFQCSVCQKSFKTRDNLRKHSKNHGEPQFKCPVCGKGCTERGNLNKHMRIHTKEKPFICELCGKAYGRKSLLDNHRRLHTGEKPYKCNFEGCDKGFRCYSNLKQHKRIHSAVHPYVCDICGKMFKQPGRLNHHRKDHTVDYRWPCSYCKEKFKSIFMYKGHLAKFHADKKKEIEENTNIRLYECELCHKMYGDKDDLTRHIYIHKNLKPFSCQYCGKCFNDKSNMRQHEKIHTGEKNHWCDICKKGFIHKRDLRNHILSNHTKVGEDVKPYKERRIRKRRTFLSDDMNMQEFGVTDMTPEQMEAPNQLDMRLINQTYQVEGHKIIVEQQEQPRDLSVPTGSTLQYLTTHGGEIQMSSFPISSVNSVTGHIEPLMIIENY